MLIHFNIRHYTLIAIDYVIIQLLRLDSLNDSQRLFSSICFYFLSPPDINPD